MTDKKIGIGVSDFKEVIKENLYFVDKSLFIKQIIDNNDKILLITRPCRFGKTLNMSMLYYYFDINEKYNKELFNGLKIMYEDSKYHTDMNNLPTIYLTLAEVKGSTYDMTINLLKSVMMDLYHEFMFLLKSNKIEDFEKERINNILYGRESESDLSRSLKELCGYLMRHYDKPVMLIIDEYDVPLQTAYVSEYYEEAIDFFKAFYTSTIKANPYLKKAVLTRSINDSKRKYI